MRHEAASGRLRPLIAHQCWRALLLVMVIVCIIPVRAAYGLPLSAFAVEAWELELVIVSVIPNQKLVEHQTIQVQYKLKARLTGLVPNPLPLSVAICPETNEGTCFVITKLVAQEFTGTIEARAPAANANAPIRIQLVIPPPCASAGPCPVSVLLHIADMKTLTESDIVLMPVAARYEIAIDSFTVLRSRSCNSDSVKISLRSGLQGETVGDSLCNVVGGNLCAINVDEGDHGSGSCLNPLNAPRVFSPVAVTNVRVGPFDLIPDVSSNLLFEYDVANLGEPYSQTATESFLNFMSQLAAGVLDATAKDNRSYDTLDNWAHQVHGLEKCDGLVAAKSWIFFNKSVRALPTVPTLESATRPTGRHQSDTEYFEGTDSAPGCGQNSLYAVNWSVIRTSWHP